MNSVNPSPPRARLPVFTVSCWALGLMGFSQLLIGGLALATRFEESKKSRTITKEVPKLVVVRIPAAAEPGQEKEPTFVSRPPRPGDEARQIELPPPTPISAPKIADPRSERLVHEARKATVAGDMGLAVMKLEEALSFSPEDPTVHFEMGRVHEQMGVFDVAAAHYEKVFQMNIDKAGSLYELAARKIGEGFQEESAHGKLSLSRVRIFKDPDHEDGERVVLTIPVQKAPGEELDLDQIGVQTIFFNRTSKGDIVQLADEEKSWVTDQWTTLPFDFTSGEETVRVTYIIPPQDAQTERLFGERNYYGQVVSLLYKGEVLDVQAWPPSLAARIPQQPATTPAGDGVLPEFQDVLPPDFDPNLPLLPPLPSQ
jgi:hypothetical protein